MPTALSLIQQRLGFAMPAQDVLAGIPLLNETLGGLLCGDGRAIRITVNRSDYGFLEKAGNRLVPLPLGRVDLELPSDWTAASGGLHLLTGEAELELDGHRSAGKLRATVLRDAPVLCLRITGLDGATVQVRNRPPDAPDVLDQFQALGLPRAQTFDLDEFGGWVQERPGLPAVCVGWLRHDLATGFVFYATAAYGDTPQGAKKAALQVLSETRTDGYTSATLRSFGGWRKWWNGIRPASTEELVLALGAYIRGGIDLPEHAQVSTSTPPIFDVELKATPDGELVIQHGGREIGRGPFRPEWLDGPAIRGHRPPTKAYRP